MKCYYELLEVARDAGDEEIKKSYRKLALKWHPDKNPDNVEECTQYFALLQQAYDVLSDAHERAFYDRHRESILRGGDSNEEKEDSLDLFQFFTTSCFKGFGDDSKGFYTVYRGVFEALSEEDYDFVDDPTVRYPSFGNSESDYETVVGPFYGFWSSFSTARTFTFLDQYDIREASNRYEARCIEAENKKYREAGKRERNEKIRELVAFVRKRDPRIAAYRIFLEERQQEAKAKQVEARRQQILKNQQQVASYLESEAAQEASRAHLEALRQQMEEEEGDSDFDDEQEDELICVICDKVFKSVNAKINHNNSKQHKKQLAEMRKFMKEEDHALFDVGEEKEAAVPASAERKGKKAKRREKRRDADVDDDIEQEDVAVGCATTNDVDECAKDLEENLNVNENANVFLDTPAKPAAEKKKRRRAAKDKNGKTEKQPVQAEEVVEECGPKVARCDKCNEFFESRTRLFQHLKESGHATLKGEVPGTKKKGKKNDNDGRD